MLANGVEPNEQVFLALLSACSRAGQVDLALEAVKLMTDEGVEPQPAHYAKLIEAAQRARDEKHAYTWLQELRAVYGRASVKDYQRVLMALGTKHSVERAEEVYSQMVEDHGSPSAGALISMCRAYARVQRIDRALELIEEYKALEFPATTKTYDHVIRYGVVQVCHAVLVE